MAVTTADERLVDVRRWRRVTAVGPTLGQRADRIYTIAISIAIFGALLFSTAHQALAQVLTPAGAATWLPAALLLGLIVAARWGVYQGPVVYAVADVGHLLGAPLSRRGLAWRRLAVGLGRGAAAGTLLGAIAVIGLDGQGGGLDAAREVGLVVGVALVGILGVAAASVVQRSARVERALGPLGVVALMAAVGGGAWGRTDPEVLRIERWSGPWGWASAPIGSRAWGLALGLLVTTTVLGAGAALARCRHCPTERHVRRAEARAGAVASLAGFDARSMRQALAEASGRRRATGGGQRIPAPKRPELLLAWRGMIALRRTPSRLAEAVVLSGGGAAVLLTAGDRITAGLVGGLALYAGATRLLEPLRQEIDVPGRAQTLLPERWGEVLYRHTHLPTAIGVASVLLAGIAVAASGVQLAPGGALLVTTLLGAAGNVMAAALSARRGGRLPVSVLTTLTAGDATGMSGGLVLGYIVAFPALGSILAAVPVLIVATGGALPVAIAVGVLPLVVLTSVLRVSERP